jgi:hypothetical protein
MRIRYSEEPGEWRKFTWASVAAPTLLALVGAWRGRWPWLVPAAVGAVALGVALVALLRPGLFRGWYRGGRWFGHQMGRIMGAVVLTVLFFLVLTPLALVLRLMGRSPLVLKPDPGMASYWTPSRAPGEFERMF